MQLFRCDIDEEAPCFVIADGILNHGCIRRIGTEPCFAAGVGQAKQSVADFRRNIRFDEIDEPSKSAREGSRSDSFEMVGRFGPVKPAAGRGQYAGGFAHAAGQRRMVDTVDCGLFAIGDHDFVPEHVDGLKAEKLRARRVNDLDPRLSDFASPQPHRRHNVDYVSVLRRQPVMGGGGAEADVIGIGDAAGERQKIAIAQSIGPMLWRDEEVRSPTRPFEPAFMAQRLDDMVGRLGGGAEQCDDFRSRCLSLTALAEGEYDPTLLGR